MTDLCHAALKFATLPLASEVDWRTDPDALGNTKRLYQNSFEQRLDFSDTFAKPWNPVRRKTMGLKQRGRRRGHHRLRQGIPDRTLAVTVGLATLVHAVHAGIGRWLCFLSKPTATIPS